MKTGWQRDKVIKYRIGDVARMFGVSTKTIDNWVAAGSFVQPLKSHAVSSSPRAGKFWTAADIEKEKLKRGIK